MGLDRDVYANADPAWLASQPRYFQGELESARGAAEQAIAQTVLAEEAAKREADDRANAEREALFRAQIAEANRPSGQGSSRSSAALYGGGDFLQRQAAAIKAEQDAIRGLAAARMGVEGANIDIARKSMDAVTPLNREELFKEHQRTAPARSQEDYFSTLASAILANGGLFSDPRTSINPIGNLGKQFNARLQDNRKQYDADMAKRDQMFNKLLELKGADYTDANTRAGRELQLNQAGNNINLLPLDALLQASKLDVDLAKNQTDVGLRLAALNESRKANRDPMQLESQRLAVLAEAMERKKAGKATMIDELRIEAAKPKAEKVPVKDKIALADEYVKLFKDDVSRSNPKLAADPKVIEAADALKRKILAGANADDAMSLTQKLFARQAGGAT